MSPNVSFSRKQKFRTVQSHSSVSESKREVGVIQLGWYRTESSGFTFMFFFSLIIECFASVSGCKSLLEKFFQLFLERRNQTILPQELGRYSPKFSISNLFYTMHNFFYILLEKSDLIKLNLENNFGPFGGLFIYLFIYWEDYNKQTNKRFRFSQEVFAWKDVLKSLFEISLVQSFCLTGKP